jgi:ABC-2 type transport system permease protein
MWLVASRELKERSRSRVFVASLIVMIVLVVASIVAPAILDNRDEAKRVGLAGAFSPNLAGAIETQGDATNIKTDIRQHPSTEAGEAAVRDGDIDLLIVDGSRLEWQRGIDEELRAVAASAIQSLAISERAAEAGINPEALRSVLSPVKMTDVKLGEVAGRTPDDETATFIMTVLLFFALSTYGTMVLTGVVEEKSSRVVEVLLARMSARTLLAGKIAGIGLLGFGQFALTALAALVAISVVDSFDVPAVRGSVLAWLAIWFVLGYAFYATMFGALGSLAARTEDMQTVAGPVTIVLVLAYFVSFATIGSPDATWAQLVSFFPATAPLAMPARMAMSAPGWWEPVLASVITTVTIVALVRLGGRVYTSAILHSGPTLKLRDVWRGSNHRGAPARGTTGEALESKKRCRTMASEEPSRVTMTVVTLLCAAIGVGAAMALQDVILGIAIGAALFAVASRIIKIWSGNGPRALHR